MNILVVGGGSIGKRHIRNLQSLGESNIWVLKRKEDIAFANEYNVSVIDSFEKASELRLDCIIVATPTSLHNESLKFGVENDLHIFMEKPLIHDRNGLIEATTLLRKHKGIFFIGYMLRFHPLVKEIKALIEQEVLGKVYHGRFEFGSYLPYWHPWEDHKEGYAARMDLGGGVISTITHDLDLVQYFFGDPDSVYCQASNLGKLGISVEEQCEAILSYKDKDVSLHLDYLQKDYDRYIKILCEEGKIVWNWHSDMIVLHKHKGDKKVIEISHETNELYVSELKMFFDLIENKRHEHDLDGKQAIMNTNLILLMKESARKRAKIDLNG